MDGTLRRTDAKAFFANERTFLHWLHVSVTIGSIAAAILGLTSHSHKHWNIQYHSVRIIALIMLLVAVALVAQTAMNFVRRIRSLEAKQDGPYDARAPPIMLGVVLIAVLGVVFAGSVVEYMGKSPLAI